MDVGPVLAGLVSFLGGLAFFMLPFVLTGVVIWALVSVLYRVFGRPGLWGLKRRNLAARTPEISVEGTLLKVQTPRGEHFETDLDTVKGFAYYRGETAANLGSRLREVVFFDGRGRGVRLPGLWAVASGEGKDAEAGGACPPGLDSIRRLCRKWRPVRVKGYLAYVWTQTLLAALLFVFALAQLDNAFGVLGARMGGQERRREFAVESFIALGIIVLAIVTLTLIWRGIVRSQLRVTARHEREAV